MCTLSMPPGRLVLDGVAGAAPDQHLAQRRAGRDHRQVALALLDGAHEEPLGVVLVVALVAQGHDAAQGDGAVVGAGLVDDLDRP